MRSAAIVANLVQMVIVLVIFILQGLALGGLTVLLLFVLLIIATFNLLILLFLGDSQRSPLGGEKPGIVKRQDLRVVYAAAPQPVLTLQHQEFVLLDIAESGARFRIRRNDSIKKRLRGRITLLCGETLHVKATVIRRQGDEAALRFKPPIGYATLLKEKQALADASA